MSAHRQAPLGSAERAEQHGGRRCQCQQQRAAFGRVLRAQVAQSLGAHHHSDADKLRLPRPQAQRQPVGGKSLASAWAVTNTSLTTNCAESGPTS